MERIIELYAGQTISQNEGYRFIRVESVYLPVIQTYLNVTKRDFYGLPLLDEITLRLINEGVHEVTELTNILGIERNLLEVTLADLCVKDMIYCKADHCSLMAKGRTALQELSYIQRSKECLKDVYLDPVNETILLEHEQLTFMDRALNDDRKLNVDFESGKLDVYKKNFESIQRIFEKEMSVYQDRTKLKPSELLKIDGIEKLFTKYISLSFAIFVSESGYDIDIVATDRKKEKLLARYKTEIISQIRTRRILKKVFTKYPLKRHYDASGCQESAELTELSRKYYKTAENSDEREEIRQAIEKAMFTNRKLKDNEFDLLFSILCKKEKKFTVCVDYLDDWCYGNDFFTTMLSRIGAKRIKQIRYSEAANLNTCMERIKKTGRMTAEQFQREPGLPYFSLQTDTGWRIRMIPEDISVLDNSTHIYRCEYVLEQVGELVSG